MFENMFEKALKIEERLTMVYYRQKKVDKDAVGPINVISYKSDNNIIISRMPMP